MSATTLFVSGIALASALLVFGSQSASAADLPARLPAKAPVYVAPPFSWTGFYIGAHAGYHWGSDRASTAANPVGWSVAGAADIDAITPGTVHPGGFMWRRPNRLQLADEQLRGGHRSRRELHGRDGKPRRYRFRGSSIRRTCSGHLPRAVSSPPCARVSVWPWTRALFYVTGGLAVTNAKFTDSFGSFANTSVAAVSSDSTHVGWTAGVGMEYAFTDNWSVKAEYLYADFGNFTQSIPNCALCGAGERNLGYAQIYREHRSYRLELQIWWPRRGQVLSPLEPWQFKPRHRPGLFSRGSQAARADRRSVRRRLPRPRRAAQRLRRLAEGADEGAAHPLRIAEAGGFGDPLDRLAGGLHALPRHLDAQPLHRLRRRGAGLGDEGAGEMPRTHAGLLGEILDRQRRIEMLARPGQQRPEAAVRRLQFQQRGELRLAAAAAVVEHQLLRGLLRDLVAVIFRDHRQRQIDAGR